MRKWQELIRLARATGTYDDYVGDGASVPWEVALPASLPLGFTMWTYKQWLDFNYPEAFKLHDWMYTPYSVQISATREEADTALYDMIADRNPVDAWIVYQAVRVGGYPYWQVSQTGYRGPQSERRSPNIPETVRIDP